MKLPAVLLLACILARLVAVDLPVPAQVVRADNGTRTDNALVTSETLDQIEYAIGGVGQASTSLKRALIGQVLYGEVPDTDMAKADGFAAQKKPEKAAPAYVQAAVSSSYWRNRELAYVLAAEAFIQIGKPTEAIKALKDLEAKAPRSTFLPRAHGLHVQILVAQGDRPAALAAITALAAFDKVRAAVAKADLLRSDKKPAEAATELATVWGTLLKPGSANENDPSAPSFVSVGFQLVADHTAANNGAGANAVLRTLCYEPIGKSAQSTAHLALAEALAAANDKPTLIAAFDHAIMAGALPDGDRGAAKKTALKILAKFDKMPEMKDEVAEYRLNVNSF